MSSRLGRPFGTTTSPRPTTLSGRAARCLQAGPLDALTLMRTVCQVERLQPEAAERMAEALLGNHPEFARLPSGHWTLTTALAPAALKEVPDAGSVQDPGHTTGPNPRLADIAFAVVDVETTGTRATGGDRITEIAIVRVQDGEVGDVYSQLVNPERAIPPYITALTRITWEMVRDQPAFRQVAPHVMERLSGAVFTAHNASFDWRFVSEELRRGAGHELAGPRLCTVKLAKALVPELPRRSLDHLTRHFAIEIEARHRAAGDALATAQALCRMLRLAEREGVRTWGDLEERLGARSARRSRTAQDRRRRAFPLPVTEDHIP